MLGQFKVGSCQSSLIRVIRIIKVSRVVRVFRVTKIIRVIMVIKVIRMIRSLPVEWSGAVVGVIRTAYSTLQLVVP